MIKMNFSYRTNRFNSAIINRPKSQQADVVFTVALTLAPLLAYLKQVEKFLWLIILACLWGSSYLFAKIGVTEIPPITFAMGRTALGASVLFLVLRFRGQRLPQWGGIWKHLALVALLHNAGPYILVAWAAQYIDSGFSAIIIGTTPLCTILLAHFLVADDRLTPTKLAGTMVGLGGLVVLVAPTLLTGVQATGAGVLAMLTVAVCYAIAIIYSRRHLRGLPALTAPTAQLMLATFYTLPLSLLIDQPLSLPMPSGLAISAWVGISVLGTALAFMVFYRLVEIATPTHISMVNYLIPIVGATLGVVVLGEQLSWNIYLGFAVILTGVLIANGIFTHYTRRGFVHSR
ncbi:MAG: DMT family transporter [Anaerolineae bacterium]|nr:DMT family transporter [Anaerolineae bacterium]